MDIAKKQELVVSVLNNVLESCFTQKEIDEEYSGDIVGEFGFGYYYSDKSTFMTIDGDKYDVEEAYDMLRKTDNPITFLNKYNWNIDESLFFKDPNIKRVYLDTLSFYEEGK